VKSRPAVRAVRPARASLVEQLTPDQLVARVRELEVQVAALAVGEREQLVRDLELQQLALETQNVELRESQGALMESQARFADLFDLAPIGYMTLDGTTRIMEANMTAGTMLGVGRALLVGLPLTAFMVGSNRWALRDLIRRCARDRARVEAQIDLRTKDARDLTVQVTIAPRQDVHGNMTGFRTTLTDVTALKRAQDKLQFLAQASAALGSSFDYRANLSIVARQAVPVLADVCIVDLVDAGGLTTRLEVAFADLRMAAALGWLHGDTAKADETTIFGHVLRTQQPLLVPECSPALLASIGAGLGDDLLVRRAGARSLIVVPLIVRETAIGVITLVSLGSDRRYTDATLSTARDLAAHAALAIDNARLYERAQEAISAREDVLSFVSHDLRNPLMGIQLTTEMILRSPPEGGERRKGWRQLERIRGGVRQMRRMIEDLLDISSLDSGRLTLVLAPHDVRRLLEDSTTLLGPLAVDKKLTLSFDVDGDVFVRCDRDRVMQVLSNLIGNAIKFTPPEGKITVTGRRVGAQALMTVSDTGPGIPPDLRPYIFDRFWRGHDDAHNGRGLGLFIAKGLVEAHGGALWIDDATESGAKFSFTLPLASGSEVARLRPTMETTRGSLGHDPIVGSG